MKKLLLIILISACSYPTFSQSSNVALLFHTNNHPDFAFLDRQSEMIKDDLLYIYGFRTSPYKNFSKLNFINSVANSCAIDSTQLFVYVAGITLMDPNGNPFIMLAGSDSTQFDKMLSYAELADTFKDCKVKNLLVVLDVAKSAANMKSQDMSVGALPYEVDSTTTKEAFVKLKMESNGRIFLASGSDSLEPRGRYTPFSSKLMEAMRNYGGVDGMLTMGEIKSYVENLVDMPVLGAFEGHKDGGDFLFISR